MNTNRFGVVAFLVIKLCFIGVILYFSHNDDLTYKVVSNILSSSDKKEKSKE